MDAENREKREQLLGEAELVREQLKAFTLKLVDVCIEHGNFDHAGQLLIACDQLIDLHYQVPMQVIH